jgi:hypothetical protein
MSIAFFLFGRHHDDQSFTGRLWAFVHGVPVPIWVAVIGIVAAVLTPLVNHYLAGRRDAAEARRAKQLREQDELRRAAHVRADLLARLRSHCSSLEPLAARYAAVDADLWQAAHDALARRARDPEVIDALGPGYHRFTKAIHAESVAINRQRAGTVTRSASPVGDVLEAYAPILVELESGP